MDATSGFEQSVIGKAPARSSRRAVALRACGAAAVLAYALYFVFPGLRSGFGPDDMMNIHYYWDLGAGALFKNLFLFSSAYGRPVGGVYFFALYELFGLDPFPYHVVTTALLLLNTFLAYRLGRLASGSRLTGALVAVGAAYHPRMAHLVYLPAFAFDVLCFTFYLLALNYYLAVRRRGEAFGPLRIALLLGLYAAALGAKEMAVTLPAVLLAYELLLHPPEHRRIPALYGWLKARAVPAFAAGLLTVLYIAGETTGPEALVNMDGYRPVFTVQRYLESNARFLNDIFCQTAEHPFFRPAMVPFVWLFLFLIGWSSRRRYLLWAVAGIVLTPLALTFIPGRGGACLYVTLVFWALFFGGLLADVAANAAAAPVLRRRPALSATAVVVLAVGWLWSAFARETSATAPGLASSGAKTWAVIQQVRALRLRPPRGGSVYFTNDVFEAWDTLFITRLVIRDRSLVVILGPRIPLSQGEIDRTDYVLTFEDGRLKRVGGKARSGLRAPEGLTPPCVSSIRQPSPRG